MHGNVLVGIVAYVVIGAVAVLCFTLLAAVLATLPRRPRRDRLTYRSPWPKRWQ
jgi:hypothetical protein